MKKILIIVAIIILAGAGFWAYKLWNAPAPAPVDFKPLTPEQKAALFDELVESSSEPAPAVEVIHQSFTELEATSASSTVTDKQKADMFKVLEESSVR
ncbi:MAG TPA: hypothetical protein VGE35_00385 [Candidatus Paceibacterota bacterium]